MSPPFVPFLIKELKLMNERMKCGLFSGTVNDMSGASFDRLQAREGNPALRPPGLREDPHGPADR